MAMCVVMWLSASGASEVVRRVWRSSEFREAEAAMAAVVGVFWAEGWGAASSWQERLGGVSVAVVVEEKTIWEVAVERVEVG